MIGLSVAEKKKIMKMKEMSGRYLGMAGSFGMDSSSFADEPDSPDIAHTSAVVLHKAAHKLDYRVDHKVDSCPLAVEQIHFD